VVEGGGKGARTPQKRKRDTGVAFSCLRCQHHPRHKECDHMVALFVSGQWEGW